jgi:hypothetical protein
VLKFISVVYLLCTGHALLSQSANTLIGSRAQALGYASSCLADEWSLFNNIAGLASIEQLAIGFTYEAHPGFKYFNRTAFVAAAPMKIGAIGFGALRAGDTRYNEQMLSVGLANTFGLASLGVKLNYIQYHAEGFGNKSLLSVSFGGIAHFSDQLSIGAHIININQGKVTEAGGERLPTIIQAGLSFTPSSKLTILTEVQKDIDYEALWKGAVEYQPFKKFVARTGFNVNPDAAFAGIGARFTKTNFDYAVQFLSQSGLVHQATVVYHFQPRKK